MTQHRLHRPQVGAMGQQVAGEGMAQHVGRDPGGIDAGRDVGGRDMKGVPAQFVRIDANGDGVLPPLYWRYARWWEALGYPAFVAMAVVFYLMVNKPALTF